MAGFEIGDRIEREEVARASELVEHPVKAERVVVMVKETPLTLCKKPGLRVMDCTQPYRITIHLI